jgi:formylglycine-generating enzyme required for sulfatase activity
VRSLFRYLVLTFAALLTFVASAAAEKRIALVIGNDRYVNLTDLQKAVNDAEVVGNTLQALGFEVVRGQNLGRQGMIDKIAEFTSKLDAGDIAVFFYAGHGVAIGNVNYLVPVDVPGANVEARVRGGSIAEGDIVAEIQAKGARVAMLVLDACRDNPFPPVGTRSVGNSRGLANSTPASGVFVLYSAGAGQTALDRLRKDDPHRNGVFTRVFVEYLAKPGLHLGDLAVEVREQVAVLARESLDDSGQPAPHVQTPAYYDQTIGGRVFLAGSGSSEPRSDSTNADLARLREELKALQDQIKKKDELKTAVVVPPVGPALPADVQPKPAVGLFPQTTIIVTPLSKERERSLKPNETFKECEVCPLMVVAPAGSFMMGSPKSESERNENEGPQRLITFQKPFSIGRFEVTFDEWDACVADGGCNRYRPVDQGWGRGSMPVINVNWSDAKAYTAWLSNRTGKAYRLLSEAEWEYAARAGTKTPFWWGTSPSTNQANYVGNQSGFFGYRGKRTGIHREKTLTVGSFSPNPWGLFQVLGNVREWTEDCWTPSYEGARSDGAAEVGGNCEFRVVRGGSWDSFPAAVRSASRSNREMKDRISDIGLRVARSLE